MKSVCAVWSKTASKLGQLNLTASASATAGPSHRMKQARVVSTSCHIFGRSTLSVLKISLLCKEEALMRKAETSTCQFKRSWADPLVLGAYLTIACRWPKDHRKDKVYLRRNPSLLRRRVQCPAVSYCAQWITIGTTGKAVRWAAGRPQHSRHCPPGQSLLRLPQHILQLSRR